MSDAGINGPCGACKFLRRKCVKGGCIFAPYFDSDQGTTHFAAVHRVFGASNASKLLLRIPPHRRLDAVITLCYEAMARVRDPVYGCVGHIFTLQQQVVNLQAELAYIQARISTLQRTPPQPPGTLSCFDLIQSSSDFVCNNSTNQAVPLNATTQSEEPSAEMVSFCNDIAVDDHEDIVEEDGTDYLQSLAREYVSVYFPGVKFKPPASL